MMRLTELVEALVAKGVELDEPNPRVRLMVHSPAGLLWLEVDSIIIDRSDDTLICLTGERDDRELEHWP